MGTSSPIPLVKNGNPLLPSWLEDPAAPVDGDGEASPDAPVDGHDDDAPGAPAAEGGSDGPLFDPPPDGVGPPDPSAAPNDGDDFDAPPFGASFTAGRSNFTRFAKSHGEDRRAMGRAARSFVRSAAGGAHTAGRRMASERRAAGAVSRLLSAAAAPGGIREFVRTENLAHLADRPVQEIYAALVDYVCPPDGSLDDAYARDAYLEAVAELTDAQHDLEQPTAATAREFMASFVANAVRLRIINSIANGVLTMPADLEIARAIDAGLMDFIRGCVNDVLADAVDVIQVDAFRQEIDDIFERVFVFVGDRGDDAAEGRE